MLDLVKFPSPLGVLYFSIFLLIILVLVAGVVSVPSRGSIFLYTLYEDGHVFSWEFPSPLGVLYFSMVGIGIDASMASAFPSPLGVLYFSMVVKFTFVLLL